MAAPLYIASLLASVSPPNYLLVAILPRIANHGEGAPEIRVGQAPIAQALQILIQGKVAFGGN